MPFLILMNSCESINSGNAEALNQEGLAYYNKGEFRTALNRFQMAIEKEDFNKLSRTGYYRNAGLCYTNLGIKDSSILMFEAAADLNDKNSFEYLLNKAEALLIREEYKAASKLLDKAYKLNKEDMSLNNTLGLMYMGEYDPDIFDPERALQHNQIAFDMDPGQFTKHNLAMNYLLLENFEKSLELYRELHEEFPNNIDYLESAIIITQYHGDPEDANKLLEELKAQDKDAYEEFMLEAEADSTTVE